MEEGWYKDEYLVLLNDQEAVVATERYGIAALLPGYRIVGLRGWDDFIVRDANGRLFAVPTVPCDIKNLEPYSLPESFDELTSDDRFAGKVKWYITPICFGGDPGVGENIVWIPMRHMPRRYGGGMASIMTFTVPIDSAPMPTAVELRKRTLREPKENAYLRIYL